MRLHVEELEGMGVRMHEQATQNRLLRVTVMRLLSAVSRLLRAETGELENPPPYQGI